MPAVVHEGDIGTIFEVTVLDAAGVIVDLSSQISMTIVFMTSAAERKEMTAVFTTDGTDGKMQYIAIIGDIDVPGQWRMQGIVVLATGTWYTSVDNFEVRENLGAGV